MAKENNPQSTMITNRNYQHVSNVPTYIRKYPDDYSQVVGICRKGQVVHADYVSPGFIYHRDGSKPTLTDNIWIKFERGYVRRVSMLGSTNYFEEYKGFEDYPPADEKTKYGDVVMLKKGALDAYGRPLDDKDYEPATHIVALLDSSKQLALLGYPKGIQTWVWRKDLKMVQKSDGFFFSEGTLNPDLGK